MNYFESNITIRRVSKFRFNGYLAHKTVEKMVFEQAGIAIPYTFSAGVPSGNSTLPVLIRTPIKTGIAGEVSKSIEFKEGQSVRFVTRFLPYKTIASGKDKDKRRFIQDKVDRELKFLGAAEAAGLDVDCVEEISINTTDFIKNDNNRFTLSDVTLLVEAKITDPSKFEVAYINGIGAKSNFGYGMILMEGGL